MGTTNDSQAFDLIVIGAGPGGYVAAIRAGQLGLKTALIEANERLGGTCLNVGCIPSKALLESSERYSALKDGLDEHGISVGSVALDLERLMSRKQGIVTELTSGIVGLMKKNKVTVFQGRGELLGAGRVAVPGVGDAAEEPARELRATSILIATGSAPVELPFLPFDGEFIVSSTEALAFDEVPKRLVVIGAGAVGLELGSVWSRLGAEVTVLEMLPQAVAFADKQIAKVLERSLKGQGLNLMLQTKVTGATVRENEIHVSYEDKRGEAGELACDKLLVAVGRRPYTAGLGLEAAGISLDEAGRVPVKVKEGFQTSAPGVYAIGDVIEGPMLAHKAEEEGIAVVERLAGLAGLVNHAVIPNVVYTHPEVASVGLTEEAAKAQGLEVAVGKFYFKANGRAKSMGETEGLAKVVADATSDRLLGVHIVGARASEMIAEAAMAMEFGGSAEDLARTCHAHPTLSEILKEAAMAVDNRAIHS